MPDTTEPFDDLVTQAHRTRVVVVGGGIAGLVAALECAKVGMPVTVVEASGRFGGTIASAEVAGVRVDTGATCWSTVGGAVRALVDELGLADRVVTPTTDRTWIAGLKRDGAAPLPEDTVLGIPANPWAEEVRPFIGLNGAWRAYLDRLRPPLTIGKEHNLDRLVRSRMGDAVVDRLVAPLTHGRFGIAPAAVDVTAAAPGLSSALTRTGSLGGAVADLLVGRPAGPALESIDGGMTLLVEALVARLEQLGAALVPSARATSISRTDDGRWAVDLTSADDAAPAVEPADVVIVATGGAAARALLASHVRAVEEGAMDAAPRRAIVTLVVDLPDLDAAPRGPEVYAVPGSRRASGAVHQTARWDWLAQAAGAGRHVVSVAFDGAHDADPLAGLDDGDVRELARNAASGLLGVDVPDEAVRGLHRAAFTLEPPASALGMTTAAETVRTGMGDHRGLAAVGAWLSGSGLARVVADARDEAERVRRAVLWGSSSPS